MKEEVIRNELEVVPTTTTEKKKNIILRTHNQRPEIFFITRENLMIAKCGKENNIPTRKSKALVSMHRCTIIIHSGVNKSRAYSILY